MKLKFYGSLFAMTALTNVYGMESSNNEINNKIYDDNIYEELYMKRIENKINNDKGFLCDFLKKILYKEQEQTAKKEEEAAQSSLETQETLQISNSPKV